MGEGSANTCDYVAFISYRHRDPDRDVARRLARAIEAYRLPAIVAGARGERRVGRVFRDEDELAAASSLPGKIQEALARSEHLIVVCSPETPKSAWVAQEIEAFVRLHGSENVHLVLAQGEPEDSFPPVLLGRQAAQAGVERVEGADVVPSADVVPASDVAGAAPAAESGFGQGSALDDAPSFEPVAADMRPDQGKKFAVEKLRVIAALVGCSFDDLRQREKMRRRKRAGGAVAAALALLVAFGGLAWRGSQAQQEALRQESVRLAGESQKALAKGDRYGALELALEALPKSSAAHDRPLVPEAQDALAAACQVVPEEGSVWRACYVKDAASWQGSSGAAAGGSASASDNESAADGAGTAPAADSAAADPTADNAADSASDSTSSSLVPDFPDPGMPVAAIGPAEGWMVLDVGEGSFDVRDALTGARLSTCTFPNQPQGATWRLAACRSKVVAYAWPQGLACFDASSGEMLWHEPDVPVDTVCASNDGESLAVTFGGSSGSLSVAVLEAATGTVVGAHVFDDAGVQSRLYLGYSCMGETAGDIYLAAENELYYVSMQNETATRQALDQPIATALAYHDGMVFAASRATYGSAPVPYSVQAFSAALELRWQAAGEFSAGLAGGPYESVASLGEPRLSFANAGQRALVVTAGNSLQALALDSGTPLHAETFDNSIVGFGAAYAQENADLLFAALADGSLEARDPTAGTLPVGDALDMQLGEPLDSATVQWVADSHYVLIARTAGDSAQVVAFRTNFGDDGSERKGDYTLDELIAYAHELLDAQR